MSLTNSWQCTYILIKGLHACTVNKIYVIVDNNFIVSCAADHSWCVTEFLEINPNYTFLLQYFYHLHCDYSVVIFSKQCIEFSTQNNDKFIANNIFAGTGKNSKILFIFYV